MIDNFLLSYISGYVFAFIFLVVVIVLFVIIDNITRKSLKPKDKLLKKIFTDDIRKNVKK